MSRPDRLAADVPRDEPAGPHGVNWGSVILPRPLGTCAHVAIDPATLGGEGEIWPCHRVEPPLESVWLRHRFPAAGPHRFELGRNVEGRAGGRIGSGACHHGSMTSIALVLGAGGVVGSAFHVGTMMALAEVTGWDARSADLIVGTSAGSGAAATLRAGLSPADHFARSQGDELSDEGRRIADALPRKQLTFPPHPGFDPLGLLRPAAPWLVASAFLAPGPVRPGLLAGLLPRGRVDSAPMGDRIRLLMSDRWPSRPTWVCATRLRDGKRVVFGRDDVDVPDLGTAVQASSAIPGYFAPVTIGGRDYVDGALFSPTNAELVARLGYDLVIVVSPMSATSDALDLSPGSLGRGLSARTLGREVGRIREEGTPVIVVQPTREDLEVMGRDLMSADVAAATARQVRSSVRRLLERDDLRDRVDILTNVAMAETH